MKRGGYPFPFLFFLILSCVLVLTPYHVGAGQKSGLLSEKNHQKLSAIHKLIDEEKTAEALRSLGELLLEVKGDDYATALVHQTYGYTYIARDDYPGAMTAFKAALELSTLPSEVSNRIRYDLAQLYLAKEKYQEGTILLEEWFFLSQNLSPEAHALAASAYIELKQFQKAILHLNQAIEDAVLPREDWYRSLLATYDLLSDYEKEVEILKVMVVRFPGKPLYWKKLTALYMELKKESKALATLELAHQQGLLGEEGTIDLAELYLHMDLPYEAGMILEEGLKDGIVHTQPEHWKWLSEVWLMAREYVRAHAALTLASSLPEK